MKARCVAKRCRLYNGPSLLSSLAAERIGMTKNLDEAHASDELRAFFSYLKKSNRTSPLIKAMEREYLKLESAPSSKKIKGIWKEMRTVVRETFTDHQRNELALMVKLKSTFPIDSDEKLGDEIIARGVIRSDDEFRTLLQLVDSWQQLEVNDSQITSANQMLADYESKKI